tara:strand:- start:1751 stop:2326 length:576 start_codon:yes stop_codon:yes gene_type:complete
MDYKFRKGYGNAVNLNCTNSTLGELDLDNTIVGIGVYPNGTPVRVSWNVGGQLKALYGTYNGDQDKVFYDPRVYTGEVISGGTMQSYQGADLMKVTSYTMQSEISNATYSNAHIPYYSNVDYSIKTPIHRGRRGDIESLVFHSGLNTVEQTGIVFVDQCNGWAYSVSPDTESLNTINDKFARSFEFKVCKK